MQNNMAYSSIFILTLVVCSCQSAGDQEIYSPSELLSADACALLGFNRDNLQCSSCKLLTKYDLDELKENCSRCCNEVENGQDSNVKKYEKARLEVCWCKFQSMPQIEAFVKSDRPKKFPNLSIKHIDGQSPIIKLINSKGMVEETMSISKWDTDTIEEFLQTHLL